MNNKLEIGAQFPVFHQPQNTVTDFDELFSQNAGKLFQFSFSILKNKEDAQDVVQETFCRIWHLREHLDPAKSCTSYLFSISYHLIVDQLRERFKNQCYCRSIGETIGAEQDVQSHQMDFQAILQIINQVTEKLPKKRKEIYQLSRKDGLSHKKIADKLGISSKTVENQINLTLKCLKAKLAKEQIY